MQKPLVTIITPSYNHGKYITKAVESVINQTYDNIEHIIVDDGSSDNSHEVLTALKEKYPQITIELHKENRGHVRISETAEKAKGEFICILSSDDWYLPKKIEKQVEKFAQLDDTWGIVHCPGYLYDDKTDKQSLDNRFEEVPEGFVLKEMLEIKFSIFPISPMYRKEAMLKYRFLDEYKALGEGINLLIAQTYKVGYIDKPLAVMRKHETNIGKNVDMMLADNVGFKTYLFNHKDFPKQLQYLRNRVIAYPRYVKGWELIRLHKRKKEGRKQLIKAAQTYPTYLFTKPRLAIGILLSFF